MKNIVVHFYDSNLSGAPSYDEAIENIRKPKQIIYTYDKNIPASVSIFSDNPNVIKDDVSKLKTVEDFHLNGIKSVKNFRDRCYEKIYINVEKQK